METGRLASIVDHLSLVYHLENTPCGVIIWDKDLRVIYCSAPAAAIFESTQETLIKQAATIYDLSYKPDLQTVQAVMHDIVSGSSLHQNSDNRNVTQTGKVIYCPVVQLGVER